MDRFKFSSIRSKKAQAFFDRQEKLEEQMQSIAHQANFDFDKNDSSNDHGNEMVIEHYLDENGRWISN